MSGGNAEHAGSGARNLSSGRGGAGMYAVFFSLSCSNLCAMATVSSFENAAANEMFPSVGNMTKNVQESPKDPQDFVTPTIKQDMYTTGRGGTGNMAKNDKEHPEIARTAQDVEAPPPRGRQGGFHVGRGGAGIFLCFDGL